MPMAGDRYKTGANYWWLDAGGWAGMREREQPRKTLELRPQRLFGGLCWCLSQRHHGGAGAALTACPARGPRPCWGRASLQELVHPKLKRLQRVGAGWALVSCPGLPN